MLFLIGQVGRDALEREAFQEVDFRRMFGQLAKWVAQIDRADRIPELVSHAFHTATAGRARPGGAGAAGGHADGASPTSPTCPATARCSRIPGRRRWPRWPSGWSGRSGRSCCVGGGSLVGAGLGRPAGLGRDVAAAGGGLVPLPGLPRQPLAVATSATSGLGINPGSPRACARPTCCVAVGARLGESTTSGYTLVEPPVPRQELVHVHADPEELGRVYAPALADQRRRRGVPRRGARAAGAGLRGVGGAHGRGAGRLRGLAAAHGPARRREPGPHRGLAGGAPAGGRDRHQRRRQLHGLAAPLLPLPALPHPAGADVRRHGLRAARRGRGEGRAPGAHRGRPGRRRLLPDGGRRARDRRAARPAA